MSYSFENLKSKITSLQARNHGTSSASTAGTTASTDDINADSFQSLASLQDAAEKRRLYTKHKRHLSMSRDKIIQANKVKRPTSTPLVHLEPETSHEGVSSADAQSSDRTNKPNSVLLSAVRNRVRNNDALGLKLKIPAKSSTPDASPCSTPGGGGGGTTPCCSPLTPGIAGAIALSRARSCSMVELYNQEGRQMKFQKSTFDVELLKKPGGKKLGFTVVGGLDTPGRPMGIYIKTIQPDGLAAEEGTLKQGDEILEVNGVTFNGMTHQEAVSVFRKLKKGTVRINIRRFMPVAQTRKDSLDEGVSVTSFPMSPSVEGGPWRHPLERRRSSDDVLEYSHREAEDSGVEKAEAPISRSENSAEFVRSAGQTELSIAPNSVFDLPSLENAENIEEQVTEGPRTPADGLVNSCLNVAMETEKSDTMQEKLKPVQLEVNNSNPGTSYSASDGPSHQPGDVEPDWGPISDDISDLVESFGPPDPLPLSPRKRGMPHGLRPRRPSTPRFMESQGSEEGSDKELEASVREFMSETSFAPIEKNPLQDVERSYETPPPPVFENNSSSLTTINKMEELPDEKRIKEDEESRDLTSRETALSEYDDVFAEDARASSMTSLGDHVTAERRSTKLPLNRLPDSPEMVNLDSKSDDAVLEMVTKDLLQVQSLDSSIVLPSAGPGDQNYNALNPEEGLTFDQEMMTTILEEPEEHAMTVSGHDLLRQASNFVEKEPSNQDGTSISPDRDDISAGCHDNMASSRVEPVKADTENLIYDGTLNNGLEEALGICHLEEDGQETVMTQSEISAESENPDFTEKSANSDSKSLALQEDLKTSGTDDKIHNSESSPASKNIDFETQTAVQSLKFQDPSSERERPSDCSMPDESSDRKSDSCLAEGTRYSFSNSSPTEDEQLFRPERFLELMLEPITPEATDTVSPSSTCTQLEPSRQQYPGESYHFPNTSDSSLVVENKAGLQVGDIPNDLQFKYSKNIESSCSTEASVTRCGINDDASEGMPSDSNIEGDLQDFKEQREGNSPDFFQQDDLDIGNHSDDKSLALLPQEETKDNENFDLNAVTSNDFFLTSEMIGLNISTSTSPNSKSENSNPVDLEEAEGSSENLSRETDVETRPSNEKQTISNVENDDVFPDNATTPLATTGLKSNLNVDDDATLVITSTRLDADLISGETDHLTSKPSRDCTLSLKQKNGLTDASHLKDKPGYLNQENTITEELGNSPSKNRSDTLASFDVIPENRLQDSIDLKPSESALEPDRNEPELSSTVLSKGSYRNEDLSNVLASHDSESLPHVSLQPDNLDSKSRANDIYENSPIVLGADHAKPTKQQFRITPDRQSVTELSFFALDIKDDVLPQTGNIGADSDNLYSIPPLPASKPPSVEDSTFFQAVDVVPETITQNRDSVSSFSTDFNDNEIIRANDELITSTADANCDSLLPHSERQELFTNCIRVSCDSRGLAGDISAEKPSTQTLDKHGTDDKRGNYFQGTGAPPRQKLSIRFLQGSEGNIHWKNVDRTEERQIHSHSEERSSIRYQISSPSKDSLDLGAEDCLVGTEGQNQDPNSVPIAILSWCSTNPSNGSSSYPVNPVD